MPRIKSAASVVVNATTKRSVVIDTDNNVWISNAAQATPPGVNTDFTTGYTKLYGVDAGKTALRGVMVSATGSKFYIYDFDGNASEWNVALSTQQETKFLSYAAVPAGSGPTTKVTLFAGIPSSAAPIISDFTLATTPAPQIGGFQTFTAPVLTNLAPVSTTATGNKVYAITDTFNPDGTLVPYDSVVITAPITTPATPANIFLYAKGTGTDTTLKNSNAVRLILDANTFTSLKGAIEKPNAGVFLFKDSKNYHLVTTDNSAKNALQVNAVDTVISPTSGRVLSSDKLDYAALNYLLNQPDFSRTYDLSGTLIPIEGQLDYFKEGYQVPNSTLELYSVSQKTLDASGEEVTRPLGLVLSTASTSGEVTASNSYYLGSSLSLNDLTQRSPSIYEKNNTLVIEWDADSKADPLYLRVNKGAAGASVDKLTLDKLLNLESELKLDLDGDQNANGTIKYSLVDSIKLLSTATVNTPIYKTSNDIFFTLKTGAPTLANNGVIDRADLLSRIDLVSPSKLRGYEVLNNRDLNRDGTVGAVVLSTVIENDNFSIYKTTAGDLVYSSNRGLSSGDRISGAVGIAFDAPLTPDDQELIESSKVVVASIQQSGRLLSIASQIMDNMTGTTVLRENNFLLNATTQAYGPSSTTAAPPGPAPSVVYAYGYSTPERQVFLAREKYYDFDLNNDGVIGDAITAQLATNGSATVYQTAAGAVYISSDPTKNPGDVVGDALLLYDLSNSPDRIDAAVFTYKADKTLSGARVFSSEIDNQNPANNKYFSESFSLDAGILKSTAKTPLEPYELRQVEVQNTIDINMDGTIGDEIKSSKFVIAPSNSSLGFGVYELETRFNDNPIFIAAKDGSGEANDAQPTAGIVYLRNAEGSASPFWSVPKYGLTDGKVVAGGMFSTAAGGSVDLVVKDESKQKAFYLVNFDASGGTVKPNGTLLTPFALYNQEVKLNFDIDKNGIVGDSVTKLASSDDFGLYQLDRSGAIALTRENTWVDSGSQGVQKSLNFTALKNANGSTWLPYGWKQQLKSDGTYQLLKSADAASISQAVFKADGAGSVYITRKVVGPQGAINTIYEVNFGASGITKNPAGTALKPGDFYKTEMNALADINGDSFVGKPYLALPVSHSLRGAANLLPKFDGYEAFADKWEATATSKFSGKQYLVKPLIDPSTAIGWDGVDFSKNSLQIFDQQSRLVSSIATPNGWQIILGSGDFNGDGKGDFATVDWAKNQVIVYKGDDKGNFAPLQQVGISFEDQTNLPRYMWKGQDIRPSDWMRPRSHGLTGDFNNDGLSDIAILETNSNKAQFKGNDVLGIYTNTKGKISLVDTVVVGNNEYTDITSGDLNKDGFADLVLVGSENGSLKVILSDKGAFSKAGVLSRQVDLSGIYYPDHARIGDINNDGNADIIVGAKTPAGTNRIIQAYIGNGTGEFSEVQNLSKNFVIPLNSGGFELNDLNKDRQFDLTLADGQTFMNVSNVVDSISTYNFSSITSVNANQFSKDYSQISLGMKFKLKFDSSTTSITAAKDGTSVATTGPNVATTFDSKGGLVPQITIQNPAAGFNVELNPATDSRYLTSGPMGSNMASNISSNIDLLPSAAELYDNKSVSHDYIVGVGGSYGTKQSYGNVYDQGHYLKYEKGDRLLFNEPGSIQVVGVAAAQDSDYSSVQGGDERVVVRLLWQPTRLASSATTKDSGITSIDIVLPNNLFQQKSYSDLASVDSVGELNRFLGDSQFINLATNKLTEKSILPFPDYPTIDGRVLFDWSEPAILSKNPYLPSYVVMKYDEGDKIDFGWKNASPKVREAVAAFNAGLANGDVAQSFGADAAERLQPITVKTSFNSEMFSVSYFDPYSDVYRSHFNNVAPSPFKPRDAQNMGGIVIQYKGYNVLDSPELLPIVHDENWSYANTYTINRKGEQLYNMEAEGAMRDDMWLLFDKTKFPGIENVTTVEDFVRIVGTDAVNVEFNA